jgi:trk system potassium uptake protein TrkH
MTALFTAWLLLSRDAAPLTALRYAAFNVISVITGTGYATADYGQWGGLAVTVMFFLMFVGGCTGSTTGGIKVFRYQVLFSAARVQIGHLARPHGVFVAHYNGKPIPERVSSAVLGLFFMFFAVFAVTAGALALHGLDFVTALSAAATAVTNVGPALGPIIGPSGTFAPLSDSAKWVLSAAMLLGRLELFTVLVLFLPSFWRP